MAQEFKKHAVVEPENKLDYTQLQEKLSNKYSNFDIKKYTETMKLKDFSFQSKLKDVLKNKISDEVINNQVTSILKLLST